MRLPSPAAVLRATLKRKALYFYFSIYSIHHLFLLVLILLFLVFLLIYLFFYFFLYYRASLRINQELGASTK